MLPNVAFPRAKTAALKALEQDRSLGEAHASLAYVKHHFEWDWPGAETEYKVAIQLDPSRATTHGRYGEYLSNVGRHDDAIAEVKLANQLSPLSLLVQSKIGWFLYQARRYNEAIPQLQGVLAADSHQYYARAFLSLCYERKHMYAEAMAEVEKANAEFTGQEGLAHAGLYASMGRSADEHRILARLGQPGPDRAQSWFWLASVYAALGEKDKAFEWLNRAYENRDYFLTFMKSEPKMDPLRSDPRFTTIMQKIGFP